jgi:ribosome-binding factor A
MKKTGGDGRRVQRVEREVQEQIAQFLLSGFKTPLPGLVTVARVIMPGDLRTAKVYVSVLGADEYFDQVISILNRRAFEIQNHIGAALKMRYCPKLQFYKDDSTSKVIRIEKILKEIEDAKKSSSTENSPESDESSLETES